MQRLLLTCPVADKDRLIAELWERGTGGVIEGEYKVVDKDSDQK